MTAGCGFIIRGVHKHCWHSAGGTKSPEYQKLQENFDTVIYHLGAARVAEELADKLFAKKLITNETREEASLATNTDTKKMRVLIPAVLAQVEIEPANYHKFVQVLSGISGAEDIVRLLRLWFFFCIIFLKFTKASSWCLYYIHTSILFVHILHILSTHLMRTTQQLL